MSVYGKIKKIEIITLQNELQSLNPEDISLEGYIRTKHETAEKYDRYVVALHIEDLIFEGSLIIVKVFLPKGLIDNELLELDCIADCSSNSCSIEIMGVIDHFDRAYNGATQIHDNRNKKDMVHA